jgi:glutamate racemase
MSNRIGIFDSGIGGYTIYKACVEKYPHHAFVLLADQLHLPYGDKNRDELLDIFDSMMNAFRSFDIHVVLIACNTMSSLLNDEIRASYDDLTLISIIEPTLSLVDPSLDVLILATQATLSSYIYQNELRKINSHRDIIEVWGRNLAKLIEEGDEESIIAFVDDYIAPHDVSQILLACTHYPLIADHIRRVSEAKLIDSITVLSDCAKHYPTSNESSMIIATAQPDGFQSKIKRLFHDEVEVHSL